MFNSKNGVHYKVYFLLETLSKTDINQCYKTWLQVHCKPLLRNKSFTFKFTLLSSHATCVNEIFLQTVIQAWHF